MHIESGETMHNVVFVSRSQTVNWSTSLTSLHIEDCEGWWLSGCCGSVAEHWLHKPGVLGSISGDCLPFYFPLYVRQEF